MLVHILTITVILMIKIILTITVPTHAAPKVLS